MNSIILEARGLTKEYKQTIALDHINLQIKKGKIYGFIGQNGAGKTTFLRLVTGLAFPTSGTLALWGKSSKEELQKQREKIEDDPSKPMYIQTVWGVGYRFNKNLSSGL